MHQEIRLHGHIDDSIEYFATAIAADIFQQRFHEIDGSALRLFSPGNELLIDRTGVHHRGNGGNFCEYMFGVEQPLADLRKPQIRNRLVLFGAVSRPDGSLCFTDDTEGHLSFDSLFLQGNALCNYFFFLSGAPGSRPHQRQEAIARRFGRYLKRSDAVGGSDDVSLAAGLVEFMAPRDMLCLVRIIHKRHRAYHNLFRELYFTYKAIPDPEFRRLQNLALAHSIEEGQQARIRIDVMYRHPANRPIVDEYRSLLIECRKKGSIDAPDNARLTRLKTLSVRNKIPPALFDTLDAMLKKDNLVRLEEQDYLAEARQILTGLFLQERKIESQIDREDLIRLLKAKGRATEHRDHTFEHLVLETGKACDEKIRDGASPSLMEGFSKVLTYFDHFDAVAAEVNFLAFMVNVRLSEEMLRQILSRKRIFDALAPDLFDHLVFAGLLKNRYLGRYGRKKVLQLRTGLEAVSEGRRTLAGVLGKLQEIDRQERLYHLLMTHLKERLRRFYSRLGSRAEQDALRSEVDAELRRKGLLSGGFPENLFRQVIADIRKEAIYLHSMLPLIIAEGNSDLREDFLLNSGLDRFYVEELEREYCERGGLELEKLQAIRRKGG